MARMGSVALALTALTLLPNLSLANELELFDTPINARVINQFRIGSEQSQFGPLTFAGGLEMVSAQSHFGAWSALALADDGVSFVGVVDTGYWIKGRLTRESAIGNLTGIEAVTMASIADETGQGLRDKWLADAEGIARAPDGTVYVSFEREHRIEHHVQDEASGFYRLKSKAPPPVPLYELRHNRGFEGIAIAPANSPLSGALVGVSEKSLDGQGNIMGFVQPQSGAPFEFSVARRDDFDVTDLAFLPNGDLVILERRFTVQSGVAMRLRRIDGKTIAPKATVAPTTMLEADMRYQIDNMEALDITVDADGTPRLTLTSDDNHSLLQRNLMLEFRLTD